MPFCCFVQASDVIERSLKQSTERSMEAFQGLPLGNLRTKGDGEAPIYPGLLFHLGSKFRVGTGGADAGDSRRSINTLSEGKSQIANVR